MAVAAAFIGVRRLTWRRRWGRLGVLLLANLLGNAVKLTTGRELALRGRRHRARHRPPYRLASRRQGLGRGPTGRRRDLSLHAAPRRATMTSVPDELEAFSRVVTQLGSFWLAINRPPPGAGLP
jgi:hypothetical protein